MRIIRRCIIIIISLAMSTYELSAQSGTIGSVSDTSSLTRLTTTDFMEGSDTTRINWIAMRTKFCLFGSYIASDGREYCRTLGLGQLVSTIWNALTDFFSTNDDDDDDDDDDANDDLPDHGGGGGPSDNSWDPPPPNPIGDVGGGGEPCESCPVYQNNGGADPDDPEIRDIKYATAVSSLDEPLNPSFIFDSVPMKKDTLQPARVNCNDSISTARGQKLTDLINGIKDSAEYKDMKQNIKTRKYEVGFAINLKADGVYPKNYNNNGASREVTITIEEFSVATGHSHPDKDSSGTQNYESVSANDIFETLSGFWKFPGKNRLRTSFVFSGNHNEDEYAVTITDSTAASSFFLNPFNYKANIINSTTNSWAGSEGDPFSLAYYYLRHRNQLIDAGYSVQTANNYANIQVAKKMNLGVSFYKKINGVFKEQKLVLDSTTGLVRAIICN